MTSQVDPKKLQSLLKGSQAAALSEDDDESSDTSAEDTSDDAGDEETDDEGEDEGEERADRDLEGRGHRG